MGDPSTAQQACILLKIIKQTLIAHTLTQRDTHATKCALTWSLQCPGAIINPFPINYSKCKCFTLKIVLLSCPLELTTHPDPLGCFFLQFFLQAQVPSICLSACLVALLPGGCMLVWPSDVCEVCKGTIPVYACQNPLYTASLTPSSPLKSFS